jgi:hypothetical protein
MRFFKYALALVLLASPTLAAVTPNSNVTPQTPTLGLAASNGTSAVTLYTAGTNGSKCSAFTAANTSGSTAYPLAVSITRSATAYIQTTVNVPLSSGNVAGVPPVNIMSPANWPGLPVDQTGSPYFYLKSGDTLTTTLATAAVTTVIQSVICADF